ncbi:MAG: cellulose binding domain-containing protein, partial [Pseudomonadota bacterium]
MHTFLQFPPTLGTLTRRAKQLTLATTLATATLFSTTSHAAVCSFAVVHEWSTGYTAGVTITNNTPTTINGWTVNWQFNANSMLDFWSANITGTNPTSATPLSWNSTIQPGQSITFGFNANKNNNLPPESPTLNGATCNVTSSSSVSSTVSSSVRSSVTSSTASSVRSSVTSSTTSSVRSSVTSSTASSVRSSV